MNRAIGSLIRSLVQPPRPMPPVQAQNQMVGIPHTLPPQIRYGSVQPGPAQNAGFTGGVIAHPMSLTAPFVPSFNAPSFGGGGGVGSSFAGRPGGYGTPAPPPPPATFVPGTSAGQTAIQSQAPSSPATFIPRTAAVQTAIASQGPTYLPSGNTPAPPPYYGSALISALAGMGRKTNPSSPYTTTTRTAI